MHTRTRRHVVALAALSLLAGVATAVVAGPTSTARAGTTTAAPTLAVSGARLVDAGTGAPLRLAGVNRSGSEYACIQGWGFFDGPVDDAAVAAIAAWHANVVRVPLNEDCWLGINGAPARYSGLAYQQAVEGFVGRLHAHGMAAILDLHWAAPGSAPATGQLQAPDATHAPAFWTSVATAFRADPSVAFELFNEPHDISWNCWRNGCWTAWGWQAAGMQQLVTAVRATGATQPLVVDGLSWGGDLSGWLANEPYDPAHALVAGWHIYNFSGCNTVACWDATAAPLAAHVPVLLTEVGENDCTAGFLDRILPWADAHGIGYLGWAWDTSSCGGGPSLITDYAGTPTAYGAGFRAHLATTLAGPAGTVLRDDFEAGSTQGWATRWGALAVGLEAGTAYTGTHGLALRVPGTGYPAAGTDQVAGLAPGGAVRLQVWSPASGRVAAAPTVYDQSWRVTVLPAQTLSAGWNTVAFTVPAALDGVRVVGLQIDDGSGWAGTLVLDSVAW